MPSSTFTSDYLTTVVSIQAVSEPVDRYVRLINEFPEGSARRLDMEANLLSMLSEYVSFLASDVRKRGAVTLYDLD